MPANATQGLVDAIKHAGGRPRFRSVASDRSTTEEAPFEGLVCDELIGGLRLVRARADASWIDCADTLPVPFATQVEKGESGLILWGLHLAAIDNRAGAVLALTDANNPDARAQWAALERLVRPEDAPNPVQAIAQFRRLEELAPRQQACLAKVWPGLDEAAGLALLPLPHNGTLAQHVAVRIPVECDPATFYAYVGGENTPVSWLPLVRPLNSAAIAALVGSHELRTTADTLARWLLVPVGPDDGESEISQAILGVVKAAEYLGVRWRTRPAEAAAYAAWLTEIYGADHDAFRPIFDAPEIVGATGS